MKFCWCTLQVKNLEQSLAFYTGIVGLEVVRRFSAGPKTEIVFLSGGGTDIELICDARQQPAQAEEGVSLGFETPSLSETCELLAKQGIRQETDIIRPNEHIQFLFVRDPDGYRIQFVENL